MEQALQANTGDLEGLLLRRVQIFEEQVDALGLSSKLLAFNSPYQVDCTWKLGEIFSAFTAGCRLLRQLAACRQLN